MPGEETVTELPELRAEGAVVYRIVDAHGNTDGIASPRLGLTRQIAESRDVFHPACGPHRVEQCTVTFGPWEPVEGGDGDAG